MPPIHISTSCLWEHMFFMNPSVILSTSKSSFSPRGQLVKTTKAKSMHAKMQISLHLSFKLLCVTRSLPKVVFGVCLSLEDQQTWFDLVSFVSGEVQLEEDLFPLEVVMQV